MQSYRKKKAQRRAEQYLENDEEMENERRSVEEQAKHQEIEPDQHSLQDQNQQTHKESKHSGYSNIQNNDPIENDNHAFTNRLAL